MACISIQVSRVKNASALLFEATFPSRNSRDNSDGSWEVQLPVWRPGRYERGDFAQFILKLVGVDENGDEIELEKSDLHRWKVPNHILKINWTLPSGHFKCGIDLCMRQFTVRKSGKLFPL